MDEKKRLFKKYIFYIFVLGDVAHIKGLVIMKKFK